MIKDEAFFGYARAGELNTFRYPGVMKSGTSGDITSTNDEVQILGEPLKKSIFYPDFMKMEGDSRYFSTENIAVIPNGIELLQRPSGLLERIRDVRAEVGYSKLIYVQGVSDPFIIPTLVYAGVQLFDDSYIVAEGLNRVKYTMFGKMNADSEVTESNLSFAGEQSELLQLSIRNGTLREVVEKFSFSSKALEMLRILDHHYYSEVEKVFPVRTPFIKANGIESLERPDLKRYRGKLVNEYRKPEGLEIALILPCSARKPYSTSKSHQAILSRISEYRKFIHEIIVTSPVGVVPRELEDVYPARFYDIPVIGMWYEEEKQMMSNLLRDYFKRNRYSRVIAYIPEDLEFISSSLPEGSDIILTGESREESIRKLRETLDASVKDTGRSKAGDRRLEGYKSIAAFQFGNWIRDYLEDTRIINNYNQDMITRKGQILLVFNRELGKFTLNKKSAEFFLANGKYLVEIDNFKPTANVYSVGVLGCTRDVRQEDEVVLTYKGEIRGVGIAKMPSEAMVQLSKGTAVKVRN